MERNVFVIDPATGKRDSLPELLSEAGVRCQSYTAAEEFLVACKPSTTGCLVCDSRLPRMDPAELAEQQALREAALALILVTEPSEVALTVRAMERGAMTALARPVDKKELAAAVRRGLELAAEHRAKRKRWLEVDERLAALTRAQREFLELLVAGKANQEIACQIGKSVRTVDRRRREVLEKMGVGTVVELALLFARWQLGPGAPGNRSWSYASRHGAS